MRMITQLEAQSEISTLCSSSELHSDLVQVVYNGRSVTVQVKPSPGYYPKRRKKRSDANTTALNRRFLHSKDGLVDMDKIRAFIDTGVEKMRPGVELAKAAEAEKAAQKIAYEAKLASMLGPKTNSYGWSFRVGPGSSPYGTRQNDMQVAGVEGNINSFGTTEGDYPMILSARVWDPVKYMILRDMIIEQVEQWNNEHQSERNNNE